MKSFIIFCLMVMAIIFANNHSAKAQIEGLYDKQTDQIADVKALTISLFLAPV